jgi:acetyl esterase
MAQHFLPKRITSPAHGSDYVPRDETAVPASNRQRGPRGRPAVGNSRDGEALVKLHPDAAAMLARVRDANIQQWHTMSVDEGREVYRQRALLFEGAEEPAGTVTDAAIPSAGGPIPIRVYRPDNRRPQPIFIYLHGGGWVFGDLNSHDAICRRIAAAAKCMVVSVEYRLAPEHRHQDQMDDVITAVTWIKEHGAELGGDPRHIAMGGDSAGGNLTAGACLRLRDEGGPRLDLQVLIYPATAPYFDTLSCHVNGEGYWLTRKDLIWFWGHFLGPGEDGPRDQYACPGIASDLRDLPPAVVVTAAFDPLRDEGEVYALKLRAAGVPVQARRYDGMIHGFVGVPAPIPAGQRAVARIASAARRAWSTGAPR